MCSTVGAKISFSDTTQRRCHYTCRLRVSGLWHVFDFRVSNCVWWLANWHLDWTAELLLFNWGTLKNVSKGNGVTTIVLLIVIAESHPRLNISIFNTVSSVPVLVLVHHLTGPVEWCLVGQFAVFTLESNHHVWHWAVTFALVSDCQQPQLKVDQKVELVSTLQPQGTANFTFLLQR